MLNPIPATFWSSGTARALIATNVGILLIALFFVLLAVQPTVTSEVVHENDSNDGQVVLSGTFFHR